MFHCLFEQDVPGSINHADGAVSGCLEGLVVRPVFFGFLGHETHVGHAAHGGRIEGSIFPAEVRHGLINPRVTAVRDHGLRVVLLTVRSPHFPADAKRRGHRRIDDDVARHVQVGDPPVRVHHREVRAVLHGRLQVGLDFFLLRGGQGADFRIDVAQPVVGIDAKVGKDLFMFFEDVFKIDGYAMAENNGVRDLHHGGLHVQRQENAAFLGLLDLFLEELP